MVNSLSCGIFSCSFGKMVACFRYAPINVHSVFLPPQKLEFNHDNQEWIHKEVNEVQEMQFFPFIYMILKYFVFHLLLNIF